jgi:serine/threonine protein phosphatase PrpC
VHHLQHIGAREEQQDAVDIYDGGDYQLLLLADGMGGHKGGEFAGKTFVSVAKKIIKQAMPEKNKKEMFQNIVEETTKAIKKHILENENSDPHTTGVIVLIENGTLYSGHIGDSRVYLFCDENLTYRSKDHSVTQMLFDLGEISEEEMATHPDQNKLLKSIGSEKTYKISYKEQKLPSGDCALLVCSDGLWEYVKQEEMAEFIYTKTPKRALELMLKQARRFGGDKGDNISVALWRNFDDEKLRKKSFIAKLKSAIKGSM